MYANATFIGAREWSSHITDSINQMQANARWGITMLFMPPTPLSSPRSPLPSAQYLTFFQAEKITVSLGWFSRGLRLTQVKARTSIIGGRDAHRKRRDKCGQLRKYRRTCSGAGSWETRRLFANVKGLSTSLPKKMRQFLPFKILLRFFSFQNSASMREIWKRRVSSSRIFCYRTCYMYLRDYRIYPFSL